MSEAVSNVRRNRGFIKLGTIKWFFKSIIQIIATSEGLMLVNEN